MSGDLPLVPQVGAVLKWKAGQSPPCEYGLQGHKEWDLDGSCVLVADQLVLTVSHVLDNPQSVCTAAYFPGRGIFVMDPSNRIPEPQAFGDRLVLVPVRHPGLRPLSWRRIRSRMKHTGHVRLHGFGAWTQAEQPYLGGISRQYTVDLGLPRRHAGESFHYDNLDLNWWSPWNGDLFARNNNSGGAMTWGDEEPEVVGIMRQGGEQPQQVGAWITDDRKAWLELYARSRRASGASLLRVENVHLTARSQSFELVVPDGSNELVATFSSVGRGRIVLRFTDRDGNGVGTTFAGHSQFAVASAQAMPGSRLLVSVQGGVTAVRGQLCVTASDGTGIQRRASV